MVALCGLSALFGGCDSTRIETVRSGLTVVSADRKRTCRFAGLEGAAALGVRTLEAGVRVSSLTMARK